jgi:hypothetical protein
VTSRLRSLAWSANHPVRLARFWAGLLGGEAAHDPLGGVAVRPGEDPGFRLRFLPTTAPKEALNDRHLHLTSTSQADQQRTVATALALGARPLDVGQRPEEGHVVLADAEGNEFCVIEPGNHFLAGCGFLGEVACDGSAAAGHFWSGALGWPLVWDQDEETAIRSPQGGPKISWGGPPFAPVTGPGRLRFELAAADGACAAAEAARLVTLGASLVRPDPGDGGPAVLADPDGRTFALLPGL